MISTQYEIQIHNKLHKKSKREEEQMILADLTRSSKRISSIYFYDAKGSALFEDITQLPEYYLTRTELPLIKKVAKTLGPILNNIEIVEFGSGDCTKISLLLEEVPDHSIHSICYTPFDVSVDAIEKSAETLLQTFPDLTVNGIVADFMTQLHVIDIQSPTLYCFLGSTIGNLSLDQAAFFLTQLRQIMKPDDLLLIGFDMVKDKTILERAYNDSQQVTEAFNKNILSVINNRIGTDFNPNDFDHIAFYNESMSRIEMHLQARKKMWIHHPSQTKPIIIQKNERILTEHSHKFTIDRINHLAVQAGLQIQQLFTDEKKWFSLVAFKKQSEEET